MLKWMQRLLWLAPEDRWGGDIVFVLVGIFVAVTIGRSRGSVGVALGVALAVVVLRHGIFYGIVKRLRSPNSVKTKS
jgi:hypothetical protein